MRDVPPQRSAGRWVPIAQAICFAGSSCLLLLSLPLTARSTGVDVDGLLVRANAVRARAGRHSLRTDPLLTDAAQVRAREIIESGAFSHQRPDGTTFANAVTARGYPYAWVGENLAIDFFHERPIVDAWRTSAAHRRNLLSDRYVHVGIGVAYGTIAGRPTAVVVQLVAQPQHPTARADLALPAEAPTA